MAMATVQQVIDRLMAFNPETEVVTDCCVSGGSNRHPFDNDQINAVTCGDHRIVIVSFDSWDDKHADWADGHGDDDDDE
jgi:hypothetical protein